MTPSGSGPAVGNRLPDVSLPFADGTRGPISASPGQRLILFFFPRAGTPGCTTEAKAFSDARAQLESHAVGVIGVSRDSVEALSRFADKHGLTIALASDADGALTGPLGLWGERSLYGRRYMGLERATLLIDDQHRIMRVWRKVRIAGHVDEVMRSVAEPNDVSEAAKP